MSRCSVTTVWSLSDDNVDTASRDRQFRERIVPELQALPGFVHGVWARTPDGSRSQQMIVFENHRSADALLAHIEANKAESAAVGVHLESLEILDVVASA
ncbi:hypothetical protein [Georgenia sp. Marseille-Q6866]